MIVLVDDDEVMLEVLSASLADAGHEVRCFDNGAAALSFLESNEPDAIVSDLMMPEMDGFELRQSYLQRLPSRSTPFLFLSSMSDPDVIVEGLERGADDYLVKPIDHRVFAAKIKSILKRRTAPERGFQGKLTDFPLSRLLKFCELKGITGSIEVAGDGVSATLQCRGGMLVTEGDSDALEKALALGTGSFTIRTDPVDFSELIAGGETPAAGAAGSQEAPMGVLSGVRVNTRLFQVQSEYLEPGQQIATLVILDGKVKLKRVSEAPLSLGRVTLQHLLEEQHVAVEREIQEKLSEKIEARQQAEPSKRERFNMLLDEGLGCYRQGEYEKALQLWEEAAALEPEDKLIASNLKIVRKKLDA